MTFPEFCGIKSWKSVDTGLPVSHKEKFEIAIKKLGGLDAVIPYIPFSFEEIFNALQKGDVRLNTLPMNKWDAASGFSVYKGEAHATGHGLWRLLHKHGINAISNAEGVCLLKEAAREWAEREGIFIA